MFKYAFVSVVFVFHWFTYENPVNSLGTYSRFVSCRSKPVRFRSLAQQSLDLIWGILFSEIKMAFCYLVYRGLFIMYVRSTTYCSEKHGMVGAHGLI